MCACESYYTLKRCRFGRWLPPPPSLCRSRTWSFPFSTTKILISFCIAQYIRTHGQMHDGNEQATQVNLKSSFLFFYASPKQICFRNCRFCFSPARGFACASVCPCVPPSERKLARFAAKNALELTAGASLFRKFAFQARCSLRALVRPSVLPSLRTSSPPVPPSERTSARFCGNERIRANGRSPLFFREGWLGRQLRWRILNPKPSRRK